MKARVLALVMLLVMMLSQVALASDTEVAEQEAVITVEASVEVDTAEQEAEVIATEQNEEAVEEIVEEVAEAIVEETIEEATEETVEEVAEEAAEEDVNVIEFEIAQETINEVERSIKGRMITPKFVRYGDIIRLTAELIGYEDVEYTVQWQAFTGIQWENVPGGNCLDYQFNLNAQNIHYEWRLVVTVAE